MKTLGAASRLKIHPLFDRCISIKRLGSKRPQSWNMTVVDPNPKKEHRHPYTKNGLDVQQDGGRIRV